MKKFINELRTNKYYHNVLIAIMVGLILFSLPLIIVEVRNAHVVNAITAYETHDSKGIKDKVILKENNLFTADSEGYYSNDFYIASLVDKFNINYLDNLYLNSKTHNLKVIKSVSAYLIVESDVGQILSEVQSDPSTPGFISQETKNVDSTVSTIDLNEKVEMSYEPFITRFNAIKTELSSNSSISLTAKIRIVYSISCSGTLNGEVYSFTDTFNSYIPVSSTNIISIDHSFSPSKSVDKSETVMVNNANYFVFSFGILCDIVAVGIAALLAYFIITKSQLTARTRKINKWLSDFNEIIINTEHDFDTSGTKVIAVSNLDDILKAEAELSTPIIFVKHDNLYNFYVSAFGSTYFYQYDENEPEKQASENDNIEE